MAQLCLRQKSAVVHDVSRKREKKPALLCFDLGTLQQICSQKFGFGAQEVLSIAQSLYETHKATTYPRTDRGYLPTSMQEEIPDVLAAVARSDPTVTPVLAQLDREFFSRVWNDKKINAHHAIILTRQAFDISRLSDKELKVYQLIRLYYFARFLPLQEADITEVSFDIGGQLFRTRGKVEIVTGWKSLFRDKGSDNGEDTADEVPDMTALWEQALDDISAGKLSLDKFMQKQLQWTRHLVDKGRSQGVKITAPVTPPCPVCKGPTRKRKGKNGDFWGCIHYPDCNGIVAGKRKKQAGRRSKASSVGVKMTAQQ